MYASACTRVSCPHRCSPGNRDVVALHPCSRAAKLSRRAMGVRAGAVADPASPPVAQEERYEEIVQRLAKVVEKLEGGGLSLEESIAAFEEGIQLARAGAARLEEAERKVEVLLEGDRTAPFSPQEK